MVPALTPALRSSRKCQKFFLWTRSDTNRRRKGRRGPLRRGCASRDRPGAARYADGDPAADAARHTDRRSPSGPTIKETPATAGRTPRRSILKISLRFPTFVTYATKIGLTICVKAVLAFRDGNMRPCEFPSQLPKVISYQFQSGAGAQDPAASNARRKAWRPMGSRRMSLRQKAPSEDDDVAREVTYQHRQVSYHRQAAGEVRSTAEVVGLQQLNLDHQNWHMRSLRWSQALCPVSAGPEGRKMK